jgi:hypothetical protein
MSLFSLHRLSPIRRYQVRQLACMAAYVIVLGAVIRAFRTPPTGPSKYLLAVLPALPILGIVFAIGRYLAEEQDEFLRLKTVLLLLGGLALTLGSTTVWGFLEGFAGAPHLPLFWVFPIFCLGMMLTLPVVAWRYR